MWATMRLWRHANDVNCTDIFVTPRESLHVANRINLYYSPAKWWSPPGYISQTVNCLTSSVWFGSRYWAYWGLSGDTTCT